MFQKETETVHTLVHAVGEEYGKDVATELSSEDDDAHGWERSKSKISRMCIIKQKFPRD